MEDVDHRRFIKIPVSYPLSDSSLDARLKPVRQRRLIDASAGDILHGPNRVHGIKIEAETVIRQEQARGHPGGTLVTVGQTMVPGDS